MDELKQRLNSIFADGYHNLLLMEETKRKYSSASFSFRDRTAIDFLVKNPEGRPVSDVADYLKISRPSTTTLIKKLEKNGLVTKVPDPYNNRSTIVKVTRKGRQYFRYQSQYREDMVKIVVDGMSDEEKEVIYEGFRRLNQFFIASINESEEKHK